MSRHQDSPRLPKLLAQRWDFVDEASPYNDILDASPPEVLEKREKLLRNSPRGPVKPGHVLYEDCMDYAETNGLREGQKGRFCTYQNGDSRATIMVQKVNNDQFFLFSPVVEHIKNGPIRTGVTVCCSDPVHISSKRYI